MHEAQSIRRPPFAARRLTLGTLAVVACLAAAASVVRWGAAPQVPATSAPQHGAAPEPPGAAPARPAIPPRAGSDAAPLAPREPVAAPPARAAAPPSTASDHATVPRLPPRIEAHARDAVDRYIADAGLDDKVTKFERDDLVTALDRVRSSSRWLRYHGNARGEAESRRRQALLDADRVFRAILGVGVGEFVAALAPQGTIEDLGAARQ